ncbi:hypothetical protein HXW73_10835 [Halomonas sp. SH5A2]|uniref:hypothetical protein n=1 Tax=Halomonas sp. SH5A2 TaxID=2749040 RepID=UPI00163DFC13|nr:hypothetical protein [Halomonas sp. SH5A2]QNI03387.1 hypothetical protein HXW73_10835 [Halomonas sp. SH5A2]
MANNSEKEMDVGGPELWSLRSRTAIKVTSLINESGVEMAHAIVEGKLGDSLRYWGSVLQMCGELGIASARMLSTKEHYAGAALLRQIVEIEYLTWTFENGYADIDKWLSSTDKERMKTFSPAQLRKNSKGRFLSEDYKNHCEKGGHPVPRGIPLLGGKFIPEAQLLLIDLLLHCWRIRDQAYSWLRKNQCCIPDQIVEVGPILSAWSKQDPAYIQACNETPEPNTINK